MKTAGTKEEIESLIREEIPSPILPFGCNSENCLEMDFSSTNEDLKSFDLSDTKIFDHYINSRLSESGKKVGIGGYWEDRVIYKRSAHFQQEAPRSLHLGLDIWAPAWTSIHAPIEGKVHSFQDNDHFGDYGPTIILEHQIQEQVFFTLYGHLSRKCLESLEKGMHIQKGQAFAELGPFPENGDWPPHLHFQAMTNLWGKSGDFPGVCAPADREKFEEIILNPWVLIN